MLDSVKSHGAFSLTGVQFCSVSLAAHQLSEAASIAYWMESHGKNGPAFHQKDMDDRFRHLADLLGYRVVPGRAG